MCCLGPIKISNLYIRFGILFGPRFQLHIAEGPVPQYLGPIKYQTYILDLRFCLDADFTAGPVSTGVSRIFERNDEKRKKQQ